MSGDSKIRGALDVIASLVLIGGALLMVWPQLSRFATAGPSREPIADASGTIAGELASHSLGAGAVAIVEFSDYECPVCRRYARTLFPEIRRMYIDSGIVTYVAMHFPLETIHTRALRAGQASECAGDQGRYWEMYSAMFDGAMALEAADIDAHATKAGLDSERFKKCMLGGATSVIRKHQAEGVRLDVSGTPTLFLGIRRADGSIALHKRVDGLVEFARLSAEIDRLAALATKR